MPLRLCQEVEQDCFVHNSTTRTRLLLSHVDIFIFIFFHSLFNFLSLSLVSVAVCTVYIRLEAACRVCSGGSFHDVEAANKKKRTWGRSMGHANGRQTHRQAQQERERKEILKERERVRACIYVRGRRRGMYLNVCVWMRVCECR